MGGVDSHDQARNYCNVTVKSVKWWKYLFWFFLDTSIINAYITYKESVSGAEKVMSHLEFRLALSKLLIGDFTGRRKVGRP